jgi:hypothetical protein
MGRPPATGTAPLRALGTIWREEFELGEFVGQGFGGAHAALDLGLKIAAEIFGDDAGIREHAKIRYGEVGQESKHSRQWRIRIAHKREAHIVGQGPFAVTGDGLHDTKRSFLAGQGLEHLGFRQEGIIEGDGHDLRVAFRNERTGNVRGSAASESNLLSQGQLREARNDLGFGEALEFGGGGGRESELDEIHEIDVAQQAEGDEARGTRMKEQSALDGIAFQKTFARANVFEHFRGKVLAGKQQAQLRVIQGGIIEERGEHLRRRVIKQGAQVVTRGGTRELQLLLELRHVTSFLPRAAGSGGRGARRIPPA